MPDTTEKESLIKVTGSIYSPQPGSFISFTFAKNETEAKTNDPWYSCREEFLWYSFQSAQMKQFIFSHGSGKNENIAAFMEELETRLGNVENKIQILPTANKSLSIVRLSDWWREQEVRRALLTIFLRCGINFNLKTFDFEEALYSNEYIKDTKDAVEAFFKGRTICKTSVYDGWVDLFGSHNRCGDWSEKSFYNNLMQNLVFAK